MFIEYIVPDKSQYLIGNQVTLCIRLINTYLNEQSFELDIFVYKLQLEIHKEYYSGYADKTNKYIDIKLQLSYTEWEIGGYGVEVYLNNNQNIKQCYCTSVDYTTTSINHPRLMLVSKDNLDDIGIHTISKLHINSIATNSFCKDYYKIDTFKEKNVLLLLLQNLNDNWQDFYLSRKNWRLYDKNIRNFFNLDYYIGSNEKKNNWIIKTLKKSIHRYQEFIDGVIINAEGLDFENIIKENNILSYLKKLKLKLVIKRDYYWPLNNYDIEQQDILLLTVKQPFCSYYQIKNIIMEGKYFSHYKPVVILMEFDNYSLEKLNIIGFKLLLASVFSNGGYYMISFEQISKINEWSIEEYFNFIIRYRDIIYDDRLSDVTKNYYRLNEDYNCFSNFEYSTAALSNKVWLVIKENIDIIYISLINISGNSNNWNDKKSNPKIQKDMTFCIPFKGEIDSVYTASPDQYSGRFKTLEYTTDVMLKRKVVNFKLDTLKYWSIIVINKKG